MHSKLATLIKQHVIWRIQNHLCLVEFAMRGGQLVLAGCKEPTTMRAATSLLAAVRAQVASGSLLGVSAQSAQASSTSSSGKSSCFPASAWVTTPTGPRLLEHLRLGDQVCQHAHHVHANTVAAQAAQSGFAELTCSPDAILIWEK